MIFGTYMLDVGTVSDLEVSTSEAMQDLFLAYLKSPSSLSDMGWPAYDSSTDTEGIIKEFGNVTATRNVTGSWLDAGCYNSSIPMRIDG